jgi:hypothetical protein
MKPDQGRYKSLEKYNCNITHGVFIVIFCLELSVLTFESIFYCHGFYIIKIQNSSL